MTEANIITAFFRSIEKGDTQKILELFDDYPIIKDPVIGELTREKGRHYFCLIATKFLSPKTESKIIHINAFYATVKWKITLTLRDQVTNIQREGIATFEFRDNKIHKLTNTHSFLLLLGALMGLKGYVLGLLPHYRKKFQKRVIKNLEEYIQFRNSTLGNKNSAAIF